MATLRQRLDDLEQRSPDRRSVYEMSDQELIVGMGLPPGTSNAEAVAYIVNCRLLSRSPTAGAASAQADTDHNEGSTS